MPLRTDTFYWDNDGDCSRNLPCNRRVARSTPTSALCHWGRHFTCLAYWWWSEGLVVRGPVGNGEWQPRFCQIAPNKNKNKQTKKNK